MVYFLPPSPCHSLVPSDRADGLAWVVDMTLAYPGGEALDMPGMFMGSCPPCHIHVHYRAYPITDLPDTSQAQLTWLYDR